MVAKTPTTGFVLASLPECHTVWAVSSGAYSDYGVNVLFETRQDAIAYCAASNAVSVDDMTYFTDVDDMETRTDAQKKKRTVEMNSDRYVRLRRKLGGYSASYVETFDFYPAAL